MAMQVNDKIYRKKVKKLEKFVKRRLGRLALDEFKNNTPKDKGYAKRNTKLKRKNKGFDIVGDYNYSGVIDRGEYPVNPVSGTGKTIRGYSTQSPQGMTTPTGKFVDKAIRDFIKRI